MSSLPLPESILMEIHKSLDCRSYQTSKKNKFSTGKASIETHLAMGKEIVHAIFTSLDMNPQTSEDISQNFVEFANINKYLELNTWTFAADQRQILWMLLGYLYLPGLARHAASWSIPDHSDHEPLDKGMPGGRFWYLPELREVDGKFELYLPVAQVIDWVVDLLGMPIEKFAQELLPKDSQAQESLTRSLYHWQNKVIPLPTTIKAYFSDKMDVKFRGAFSMDNERSPEDQYALAVEFVTRRQITVEKLRMEIPMTQVGRLEAVLDGSADKYEKAYFVKCLVDRYSTPSPRIIRQRLLIARMVQDGYFRLLNFLCPGVDPECVDPKQNKILQLFAIYKIIYNLTIDAWSNCGDQGEMAENAWFEEHLPISDRYGLFLSILPSRKETASMELAQLLTRFFLNLKSGAELEDHVGLDEKSAENIIKRNIERTKALNDEDDAVKSLIGRTKYSSPWRALQQEDRYWVVSQVAHNTSLTPRAKEAAIQRLRELASTPVEAVQATLIELHGYLNGDRHKRPKDTRTRVQILLDEVEASEGYDLWKAAILQYKAKHMLACNDFEEAEKLFRAALDVADERNYGALRGEVARDCLALAVANHCLIPNNHVRYFREMISGGIVESEEIPSIEDTARLAANHFWETLYNPYPGVERFKPLAFDKLKDAFEIIKDGNQDALLSWMDYNHKNLNSRLPLVTGDSLLINWIKLRTNLLQRLPKIELAERLRQAIILLVQKTPKQVNITDFKGQTPLMLMAEAGDTELVKIMLRSGADPDMQDWQGMTALHSAIKSRVNSCVDALLDHPCLLDRCTNDGQSPLHTAAWTANIHATRRLLQLAPELAWQSNKHGMTPIEHIKFLIDNPEALQIFNEKITSNGVSSTSKAILESIVRTLEQAEPSASA